MPLCDKSYTYFPTKKQTQLMCFSAASVVSFQEETLVAAKELYGGYFNTCIYKSVLETSSLRMTASDTNHVLT